MMGKKSPKKPQIPMVAIYSNWHAVTELQTQIYAISNYMNVKNITNFRKMHFVLGIKNKNELIPEFVVQFKI